MKVKIIHSDYISFDCAIGKVVNAREFGSGFMIKVGEVFEYSEYISCVWVGEGDREFYFSAWEVEEVKEPFEYWNKLKSGELHAQL